MFLHSAVGAVTSCTVTVASQVAVSPLLSSTVRVTVLGPTLEQSKLVLLAVRDLIPQASPLPPSMSAAVIVAWPLESRFRSMFLHSAVGAVTSCTVTVASQVAVSPLLSSIVSVTVLGRSVEQSKLVLLRLCDLSPHASPLPPSMSAAVIVAWPVE